MKIIPIAFTSRELSDFSSVLDLAASRLSKPWSLVDSEVIADFHVVSIHDPEEFSLLAESAPDLDRIIVYSDGQFPTRARWTLTRRESSPPRVSELITLLQRIEKHLEETAFPEDVPSPPDEDRPRDSAMLGAESAAGPFVEEQPVSELFAAEEQSAPDNPSEGPVSTAALEELAERPAGNPESKATAESPDQAAESSNTSISQSAPSWRKRLIRIFSSRRESDPE
jgi:hypothetical protein